jgi:hypothetical protein
MREVDQVFDTPTVATVNKPLKTRNFRINRKGCLRRGVDVGNKARETEFVVVETD